MNDNTTPQNPTQIRNGLINNLEGIAAWFYGLPEELEHLDKSDLLKIQQAAEQAEDRLQQSLRYLSRMTGRRYS
jgi:hypothetical protein